MWALNLLKRNKCASLKELQLDDSFSIKNSLIYHLSENGMFQYFKTVIFVSSVKDQYVPSYSSRVQINPRAEFDPKLGPTLVSMTANILSQIDHTRFYRIIVENNTTEGANVDNIIGRTAHISYLDNPIVTSQLVYTLFPFFVNK